VLCFNLRPVLPHSIIPHYLINVTILEKKKFTEHKMCVLIFSITFFSDRVLRRVFGPKRDKVTGNGENYIMRSLVICTPYPILCGW